MRKYSIALLSLSLLMTSVNSHADTKRLINTRDMYPTVSPDSNTLFFQSNRTGRGQIFSIDLTVESSSPTATQLTDLALGAETPVISPNGKRVVFAAYVGEDNNDVYVMNADGSEKTRLTFGPGYDGHPRWNADGSRIVFNSDRTSPDPNASWSDRWHEIFSMNSDGSDIRQHTHCEAVCTYGSVSPDGTKVLYRKVISGAGLNWALDSIATNSEIFISDLDGGNEINLSGNAAFDGWPIWSPDGGMIAFASNRSGPANSGQIWSMKPDGSDLQQITHGPWSHAQPAWAFDGASIYAYQFKETSEYEFGSIVQIVVD